MYKKRKYDIIQTHKAHKIYQMDINKRTSKIFEDYNPHHLHNV